MRLWQLEEEARAQQLIPQVAENNGPRLPGRPRGSKNKKAAVRAAAQDLGVDRHEADEAVATAAMPQSMSQGLAGTGWEMLETRGILVAACRNGIRPVSGKQKP
jgi:hypothetical protein